MDPGGAAHVPLVAALRNPTVRLHYLRARDALVEYGHSDLWPEMPGPAGWGALASARVQHHLDGLARTFDAAAAFKTPHRSSADIGPAARPVRPRGAGRQSCAQGSVDVGEIVGQGGGAR